MDLNDMPEPAELTPEEQAWEAELARLRAERGEAFLEESARRKIGEQMLQRAMEDIERAEILELIKGLGQWEWRPAEPGWSVDGDTRG